MFTFLFFYTIKKLEKILIIRNSDFKVRATWHMYLIVRGSMTKFPFD